MIFQPMSTQRLLRAYATEAGYESLRMLRSPSFAVPFLLIPVMVYLLMGVVIFGAALRNDAKAAMSIFAGLTVFGMIGPGLFGFGCSISVERDQGLLRLKRALPVPPGSYLLAKMLMAMLFNGLITVTMVAAGLWAGHLPLAAGQILRLGAINIAGALPFCALGLLVGVLVTGSSAPGFVNLVYLPMMWLSGLFIPLPQSLQAAAPVWPAWHLLQLSLGAVGMPTSGASLTHAGVLAAVTLVAFLIAVRRLSRAG